MVGSGWQLPFTLLDVNALSLHFILTFVALIVASDIAKQATWLDVRRMNLTSVPVVGIFMGLQKLLFLYLLAFYFYDELPWYWEYSFDYDLKL